MASEPRKPPIASTCRCPSAATAKRYRAQVSDCSFCAIIAGTTPAHLVLADASSVAFLDARPVFKGHVLVVPRAHYRTLADLPVPLIEPFFGAVRLISAAIPAALGAQGTFVGMNNVVSQSVPHLHAHVVPRTKGDGLRGFFWPRHKYESEQEAAGYAARIRAAIDAGPPPAGPAPPAGPSPPAGPAPPAGSSANERLSQQRKGNGRRRDYPGRYG
ncbi:MAG TPA: HIT family protein [Streptosporangiaceae bacterium]|nr:HIT family protein [Streptosporangiaceae bacterium]